MCELEELALFQEITLNEALKYFSRLYGMSDELTLSRIKFLVDFLDLPDADRLIGTMRYVSV
jgi:ABC-type multidrug transport system ATPase subunit